MIAVVRPLLALSLCAVSLGAVGATYNVSIEGLTYSPDRLTIAPGDHVVFEASDSHPFTLDDGSYSCQDTCEIVFPNVGVAPFHCVAHEPFGMVGSIEIVEQPLFLDGFESP